MRIARYLGYPHQVRGMGTVGINHIVDHGYAHLLRTLSPSKTVVTVHDLIPILGWRGEIPGFRYPHRPRMLEYSLGFLRRAGRVVTVSQSTKADLVNHMDIPSDRVAVVANGLNEVFGVLDVPKKELRRALGLPEQGYVVLVSGPDGACKNHQTSLEVLKRLRDIIPEPVFMVRYGDFTGGDSKNDVWAKRVRRMGLEQSTLATGVISDVELVRLFNASDCLLFPSLYEGFGWPPLEAMACGVPVVSSNAASLPEVMGDAGLMADPLDIDGLTAGVRRVLTDETLRSELVSKGFERVRHFTWERAARSMLDIYREIGL